jgi:hypothetical protein
LLSCSVKIPDGEQRKNIQTKYTTKKSPTTQYGSLNFTYVIRKISFSQKILRVVAPSNTNWKNRCSGATTALSYLS